MVARKRQLLPSELNAMKDIHEMRNEYQGQDACSKWMCHAR